MNNLVSNKPDTKQRPVPYFKIIISSWLVIGTLDILLAILQSVIYGGSPVRMLQFIASGVFGKQAFSGGVLFALYGLLLHYCIAFVWAALFFKFYHELKLVTKNRLFTGVIYGILVWVIMNIIVMPLSNTPPVKFHLIKTIISVLVIVAAIGLPLSFIANKFFSKGEAASKVNNV